MKFLLKILFSPIIAVLVVIIWFCSFILNLSAWIFGIISTILGLLGLAVLVVDNVLNGIIILIFAFLVSPVGLPMLAARIIGLIQQFRFFIQDTIYR